MCDNQELPQFRPVSQALFLATGILVPAIDRRGLGKAKEQLDVVQNRSLGALD